jgi:DNA-binding SARP family transcriptional activator
MSAKTERTLLACEWSRPELRLLGGFAMHVDGTVIDLPESSQRVIAFLALHDRPQSRHVIAAELWPESSETRAAANLRSAIWRLPDHDGLAMVEARGHVLAVADDVVIDVRHVEEVGWSLVRDSCATVHADQGKLFFDDLLPGWYDDWVIVERERLAQLRLHFLDATTAALLRSGHVAEALDVAVRLVAFDPLRERSQRALLSVYRAEGSHGQALRQLERYRALMWETFACEPSDELVNLALGDSDDRQAVGARPTA